MRIHWLFPHFLFVKLIRFFSFYFFFLICDQLSFIKKKDLPSKAVCERYVREAVFWWGQWNGPVLRDDFSVIIMDFFFSFFFLLHFFSAFFHHFCLAARNLTTEKAHVLFVKLNWRIVAVFRVTKNCLGRKAVNAQRLYSTDVNSLITETNNSKGKKNYLKWTLKSDCLILIFFYFLVFKSLCALLFLCCCCFLLINTMCNKIDAFEN